MTLHLTIPTRAEPIPPSARSLRPLSSPRAARLSRSANGPPASTDQGAIGGPAGGFAPNRATRLRALVRRGVAEWGPPRDTQTDGSFVYYKHFLHTNGLNEPPPIRFDGRARPKWMETNCNTATPYRGTEMDWMGFYYAVHSTTSSKYSYAQIKDVYIQTCGGSCDGGTPHWADEVAAANTLYGATSAKAKHWADRGNDFGVDH
jgi:hypothetical protein